jgi:DNA repair photolyase
MNKKLEEYKSPRITSEVLECSMPLTFDQYSNCGYNCAYCFSQYIRGVGPGKDNYDDKNIKAVIVEKFRDIFTLKKETPYSDYIRQKIPMQWGGLSDPFCPLEEKYGVGLEIMKILNELEYPVSFSSKSDLILRDERYFNEFKKAGARWHYKASIITNDEEQARLVEVGVPSPAKRFAVLKKLSAVGTKTTLRMRPFVIGLTDKSLEDLIKNASEAGCQSATTEFFCLDWRASGREKTRANYDRLSKAIGFDIFEFYRQFKGKFAGYVRLDYNIKKVWADRFVAMCHKYNVKPFFSDVDFKHYCEGSGSCCGILDENEGLNNYCRMQYTYLVNEAKKKGFITFDEAMELGKKERVFKETCKIETFMNLGGGCKRASLKNLTYFDYFKKGWDDLKWANNMQNFTNKTLIAKGRDKNGHYIYFYNPKKL